MVFCFFFFFSSRRRHTRCLSDWSSDVCSSDLRLLLKVEREIGFGEIEMTKILLVEDNEMNRDMLSRRLIKRGYEIVMACDGQEGIELARKEQPDLKIGRASCRERV